jgi:hypothetical protein
MLSNYLVVFRTLQPATDLNIPLDESHGDPAMPRKKSVRNLFSSPRSWRKDTLSTGLKIDPDSITTQKQGEASTISHYNLEDLRK